LEGLSLKKLQITLLDAGFDIARAASKEQGGRPSFITGRSAKHVEQCLLCQKENTSSSSDGIVSQPREKVSMMPHRVALSVGGMTCSSCSNTITDMVSKIPGVSHTAVNLIDGSATVVVDSLGLVDIVRETIENCGFEAQVVNIDPVQTSTTKLQEITRVISLQVDGMFCQLVIHKLSIGYFSFIS
jgi:Cu+-exporting ATPase